MVGMDPAEQRSIHGATILGLVLVSALLLLEVRPLLDEVRGAALLDREALESIWTYINTLNTGFTFAVLFAVLFVSGAGIPIPEDLPLTFTGILLSLPQTAAYFGGFIPALVTTGSMIYISIITGDLVAYWLGHRFGRDIASWRGLRRALSPKRLARLERWFARYGNWAVFLGRMMAGVRFVTFVSAGIARMPVHRFVIFDTLASLITVPAWIYLGYMIGTHFDRLKVWMGRVNTTTWIIAAAGILAFFVVRKILQRRRERETEANPPQSG
ncbi:MAG: DedA family protein [Pseudomonadota bacterium]